MKRRERYHHGDLRAALITAGLDLVRAGGSGAVTTRACAQRNGVASSALFRHFPDRRALLTAIAIEGFHLLAKSMQKAERGQTREERLIAIGRAYLDFAIAEPHLFRLMYDGGELNLADPGLKAASDPLLEQTANEVGAAGELRLRRALLAWALVHGLATLALDSQLDGLIPDDPVERAVWQEAMLRDSLPIFSDD